MVIRSGLGLEIRTMVWSLGLWSGLWSGCRICLLFSIVVWYSGLDCGLVFNSGLGLEIRTVGWSQDFGLVLMIVV